MNRNGQDLITILTAPHIQSAQRRYSLLDFARTKGWRPSYEIEDYPRAQHFANAHLVIEHGLDISAVISFLKVDNPYRRLPPQDRNALVSLSYNNLVEWHILPDPQGVTFVFNRTDPPTESYLPLSSEKLDPWRAEEFDQIVGRRPHPNLKRLDDALIETLSRWKRTLGPELGQEIPVESISALFNAIIFVRAIEDYRRRGDSNSDQLLLEIWRQKRASKLRSILTLSLEELEVKDLPRDILNLDILSQFDRLDPATVSELLKDFYFNRFARPYDYNFSIMSKHALSRIYEKYVALLRPRESQQMKFWPEWDDEVTNRELGGFYTPQYIARFFARYLKENLTPPVFRSMKIADPACGSGMFLRTTLEMQCDPLQEIDTRVSTELAFANVMGVDIDPNACHATRLSLSLLYLTIMGHPPTKLQIHNESALDFITSRLDLRGVYDAVITNPPFIKYDMMLDQRDQVRAFLAEFGRGRIDMYLAHLKIGMDLVKPGGFLLYVLPHSFMLADNARGLRQRISSEFWVRFVADLSQIAVFENVDTYVILLILQKKNSTQDQPQATVVRCSDFPGQALQDALEGKKITGGAYDVYEVEQSNFADNNWGHSLDRPWHVGLQEKFKRFPTLDSFLIIREGMITGADDVFIRDENQIPTKEREIYQPLLSDREMEKFSVPQKTRQFVFYPYVDGERITEKVLRSNYPTTWKWIEKNSVFLKKRSSVKGGVNPWWSPIRPRPPENMMRPKIISPHLVLLPRFSLDRDGKYAVSHCPLLYPKESGNEVEMLRYFLAVLNSSAVFWQLANLSHKYSHGYLMLEPKTLKQVRVPDPGAVGAATMKKIQTIISKLIKGIDFDRLDQVLDVMVSDLYGLEDSERQEIGIE
jgi:hypothetical protein